MVSGERVNTVANSRTMLVLKVTTPQSNVMSSMMQVIINYNEIITDVSIISEEKKFQMFRYVR